MMGVDSTDLVRARYERRALRSGQHAKAALELFTAPQADYSLEHEFINAVELASHFACLAKPAPEPTE